MKNILILPLVMIIGAFALILCAHSAGNISAIATAYYVLSALAAMGAVIADSIISKKNDSGVYAEASRTER